jgi:deoxyribodipyrimidine photo-lyase
LPIFIFDTNVLSHFPDKDKRLSFLLDALKHLDNQLAKYHGCHLHIYHGDSAKLIPEICTAYNIQNVFFNESYGYNSTKRDVTLADRCRESSITLHTYSDFLLVPIDKIPTRKVFTPFFKLREKEIAAHPNYVKTKTTPNINIQIPSIFETTSKKNET